MVSTDKIEHVTMPLPPARLVIWWALVVVAIVTPGCLSAPENNATYAEFASKYVYLDHESELGLGEYYNWQRVLSGKWGSPIVVTLDKTGWVYLKEPPAAEFVPGRSLGSWEYNVRVTVDVRGVTHVFQEGATIGAGVSERQVAVEQVARRVLKKIYRIAVEAGVVGAASP